MEIQTISATLLGSTHGCFWLLPSVTSSTGLSVDILKFRHPVFSLPREFQVCYCQPIIWWNLDYLGHCCQPIYIMGYFHCSIPFTWWDISSAVANPFLARAMVFSLLLPINLFGKQHGDKHRKWVGNSRFEVPWITNPFILWARIEWSNFQNIYCMRAIIIHSWIETTLVYKPRILGPKIEEFTCSLNELSVILTALQ